MKLTCGIVMDLLPLYEEGICSEETKQAVEEHLRECHICRSFLEDVHSFPKETALPKEKKASNADKAVVKGFKKIKKYWYLSLIVALLLVPMSYLSWNQAHATGIHFTNIREHYIAEQFLKALTEDNYEEAFKYLNVKDKKAQFASLGKKKLEDFEEKAYKIFMESAKPLQEMGGIKDYKYYGVRQGIVGNHTEYMMTYQLIGKDNQDLGVAEFYVRDNGVGFFGNNAPYTTDSISYFGMWGYWLWAELNGCSWDMEAKEYVYY